MANIKNIKFDQLFKLIKIKSQNFIQQNKGKLFVNAHIDI